MLDEQVKEKNAVKTKQKQQDRDLEKSTNTSFYTPSHVWEERPWERYVDLNPQRYQNDLFRAKVQKETRETKHKQSEKEEYSSWVNSEMKRSADVLAKARLLQRPIFFSAKVFAKGFLAHANFAKTFSVRQSIASY